MALTDDQYKTLIQTECNVTDNADVTTNIPLYWDMYAGYGQLAQYWYGRLHALQGCLRDLVTDVDIQNGTDRSANSQSFRAVMTMINFAEKQILRYDPSGNASEVFYSITGVSNNLTFPHPCDGSFRLPACPDGTLPWETCGDYSPYDYSYNPLR